jgi:dipeptidyl aminopeptidase/acylaminoacyl peptidase
VICNLAGIRLIDVLCRVSSRFVSQLSIASSALSVGLLLSPAGAAEASLHHFLFVAISPDGTRVASVEVEETVDPAKPKSQVLAIRPVGRGATVRLQPCDVAPTCAYASPAWSPDSQRLAFVVQGQGLARRFVYEVNADGSGLRRLLAFDGTLGALRFARNGAELSLLATAGAHKEIGATQPGAPIVGEIGARPDVQRIAVLATDTGQLRYASPADLFVYEYDRGPDDNFVGTAAHGNGDDNWWVARLYAFDGRSGAARELFAPTSNRMQLAAPRLSPDGRLVAFIGGIMSDFSSTGGDVYVLPLGGGRASPVDVTPDMPASATSLAWNCTDDTLFFSELRNEREALRSVTFSSTLPVVFETAAQPLWSAAIGISTGEMGEGRFSLACDGSHTSALVRQTFERPPEIAAGPFGAWHDLSNENADMAPETRATSVTWKNDGFRVQGWLLAPLRIDFSKPHPMITVVHGGPSAASTPRFVEGGDIRDFLRDGYYVFFPNPRGSFGQGERFTLANVEDFGGGDLRDILAGIDEIEKQAPVDDRRLGIYGVSYGGYMTMWAVTQTQRFRAGVAGAGIADWISYYGENGIDEWMIPFFGASAYDDPAVYRKSSPIEFIKNVKTPTFAFVGERDVECPAPQSLEFWHALQTLGVATSLVIYPGEGHHIRQPAHVHDLELRTLAWFDHYLR